MYFYQKVLFKYIKLENGRSTLGCLTQYSLQYDCLY